MSSGFYGLVVKDHVGIVNTKLVYVDDDAEPEKLGAHVLSYVNEMNAPTSRDLALKLMLVDGTECPPPDYVEERFPELYRQRSGWVTSFDLGSEGATWTRWLGEFKSIGTDLARGVTEDAAFWGDGVWGYVIDFEQEALEVYRSKAVPPAGYEGRVLNESFYRVASFAWKWMPSEELFLASAYEREVEGSDAGEQWLR